MDSKDPKDMASQATPYEAWRGEPLSPVDHAMLALIVNAWRTSAPVDREAAEFDLVQAGFPYSEVRSSRDRLWSRTPPLITSHDVDFTKLPSLDDMIDVLRQKAKEQARTTAPTLAGLIELGDDNCIAELDLLAQIVASLRKAYRPDRRQLSLDEIGAGSGVSVPDVQRLAPFTELYSGEQFQLDGRVLGWSSFADFLNDRLGAAPVVSAGADLHHLPELQIDFLPSALRWSNLGPYAEASLELSPLTVLVGGNGAGKTSVLRVIDLARAIAAEGLEVIARRAGKGSPIFLPKDLIRDGVAKISLQLEGELHKQGAAWVRSQWSASILTHPRIATRDEVLQLDGAHTEAALHFGVGTWAGADRQPEPVHLRPDQLVLREATDPRRHPGLIAMRQSLSRWIAVTEATPPALPWFEPPTPIELRAPSSLLLQAPALDLKTLEEAATAVLGPVKLLASFRNTIKLIDRRGRSIPLVQAPSGIAQVVGILALLLQPEPPTLLAIDEIENHLHADVAERLIEVMRGFTHRTRIVLTTHSGNVLRLMSPEEVRVVRAGPQDSTIVRADEDPLLGRLVEAGAMGELLEHGYFAGDR